MNQKKLHTFTNDTLGHDDGVGLATKLHTGEVSAKEMMTDAIARIEDINGTVNALITPDYDRAIAYAKRIDEQRANGETLPFFAGVPTAIKDNSRQEGLPTKQGTAALVNAQPEKKHGESVEHILSTGAISVGKTMMPEFGLSAGAEPVHGTPARNPWDTNITPGASSSGASILTAAGALPFAHANDGGGSIRIPASCCGLVGLKPTRGRLVVDSMHKSLPVNIVSDGIVSRSVRDTAKWYAEMERHYQNKKLKPIGDVTGASSRRLKIGYFIDVPTGVKAGDDVRAGLEKMVTLLEGMCHEVSPFEIDASKIPHMEDDFKLYWASLAFLMSRFGRILFDKRFEKGKTEPFTEGLADVFKKRFYKMPATLLRLKALKNFYQSMFKDMDIILSPTCMHATPQIGHLNPAQDFDELYEKLNQFMCTTPVHNAAGSPAISLPMGLNAQGNPMGAQFAAALGDEKTLLELAFELEEATPWPKITD